MGFQVVIAIASDSGYTLYRRSLPALTALPREQAQRLTHDETAIAQEVSKTALSRYLNWETDTGVYVLEDDHYWQALAVSLAIEGTTTPAGVLVVPKRGDSLRRLYTRSQGARETAQILTQEYGVSPADSKAAVRTVLASWGEIVSVSESQ